ncbi:MAG TPA: hypothetical protein VIV14_07440 [Gammaproteobacteria bacterium]
MNGVDLLLGAIAGAMIVISGGLYALLLALGRLRESRRLETLSNFAYLVLALFVVVLAESLALERSWYPVVAVMLVGYLVAPRCIWRLTQSTHADSHGDAQ